jgi:hypothetical protein
LHDEVLALELCPGVAVFEDFAVGAAVEPRNQERRPDIARELKFPNSREDRYGGWEW